VLFGSLPANAEGKSMSCAKSVPLLTPFDLVHSCARAHINVPMHAALWQRVSVGSFARAQNRLGQVGQFAGFRGE
jgi:hypothetical protein